MVKYMIGAKEIMVNVNPGFTVRTPQLRAEKAGADGGLVRSKGSSVNEV